MASSVMTTIYNQYSTTYMPRKSDNRYDSHKRSELRNICTTMAKINRDAPLYLLNNSGNTRKYVIDLKENTRELRNTIIDSLGGVDNTDFNGKIAYSTNENVIQVKYIGNHASKEALPGTDDSSDNDGVFVSTTGEIPTYEIEVTTLASPQVNLGKYLPMNERGIEPGEYSFDVTVNDLGYEFQFNIHGGDTNHEIQQRLSRLINNSKIGLNASVEENSEGNTSLRIESTRVGIDYGQSSMIFSISEATGNRNTNIVEYLGINHIAREASNAHFKVNGIEASASSNTFILQNDYEITLNGISENEGQTTTVGVKPDTIALQENISNLIGGYNDFIRSMNEYQESQERSRQLTKDMRKIAGFYQEEMTKLGISPNEDGTLSLDGQKLNEAVALEKTPKSLSSLKSFSQSILRKSDQVALNPISYVNKVVVAYKNPSQTLFSPYVTSAYAGMLFNNYC